MSDLFVIGAGASKPYGFPTGNELLEQMKWLAKKYLTKQPYSDYDKEIIKIILDDNCDEKDLE